jgi:hypothetical protein
MGHYFHASAHSGDGGPVHRLHRRAPGWEREYEKMKRRFAAGYPVVYLDRNYD